MGQKGAERCNAFQTVAKIYMSEKDILGLGATMYSSPVEALNLIVDSKSQPVELDTVTTGSTSLQSYSSVDFDLRPLYVRFDMTFDVALLDDSSFGKLTNSCN